MSLFVNKIKVKAAHFLRVCKCITWILFILWFFMTSKICLIIVHGFMNAAIKNYGYDQWSLTINVNSYIYEHQSCMINDHRYRYEHQSCMINDHRYRYEHWSSMIIDHEHNYSWSMIVAMKCCWSYMISVDHCIISWTLLCWLLCVMKKNRYFKQYFNKSGNGN